MTALKKMHKHEAPSPAGMATLSKSSVMDLFHDPASFDRDVFTDHVRQSLIQVHGDSVVIDEYVVAMLADSMHTYCLAEASLREEPLVEKAINGTRMVNPNFKLRDACLTRVLQLITMAGLVPKDRPKKGEDKSDLDILLEGPKLS